MSATRVGIPEISNRQLGYLARIIKPVISLEVLPLGRWPRDEVRVYFVRLPKNLREDNFLFEPTFVGKPVRLTEAGRITTLHVPGSAGRVFSPTVAEVLAQIPERFLGQGVLPDDRITAFETFLPGRDPGFDESGQFHIATTVILSPAAPNSRVLQRLHYT